MEGWTHVFLRQINSKPLENLPGVAAQCTEKGTITIHDDEAKLLIGLQQFTQSFSMELVITEIKRGIDGFEGLKVNVDLPLLSFGGNDFATVHNQSVRGYLVIQFQTLLCGCDGRQNGESIDSRLDI